MLSLLIKKEILDQLLSLRFAISCVVCFVVILSSVIVLTKDYREELLDYNTNVVMHKNEVERYDNPWPLRYQGVNVDKPLNSLKIFFKGIDRGNTATVRVSANNEPFLQSSAEANPVVALFPVVDLTFFIGIIMSLLAVAFSYDGISGEKEMGTLRLMMSYSVPRYTVLLGKWIGGYVMLIGPFLISILCGLIIALLFPDVDLGGVGWAAFWTTLLIALLYLSAVYSLGIFVSTRTALASTSITVLLLVWVVVVLAIPNLSPYVAGIIRPTPSVQGLTQEMQKIEQEHQRKFQEEFFQKWYPEAQKKGVPFNEIVKKYNEDQRVMREKIASEQKRIVDHFRRRLDTQVDLSRNVSRLSPLSSFLYCATDLSGTGAKERDHFMKAIDRYRERWTSYASAKFEEFDFQNYEASRSKFKVGDYPKFVYDAPGLGDRVGDVFIDILFLAIWNIVFFVGAYMSFLKYDVR